MGQIKRNCRLVVLSVFFVGCLGNDREENVRYELFLPVTSIKIPLDGIKPAGNRSQLLITYKVTNSCQQLLQTQLEDKEHNIYSYVVFGIQSQQSGCRQKIEEKNYTFTFLPHKGGKYILKFATGENEDKTYIYKQLEVNIPDR
ncbi:hypothetical protein GNY06_00900 [Elizabethkingia argentiflava]|uniref:Lipoprotein n=1 Tax=Elizabethkingia argenteiflava TaxID=2681556 RepID=A0A845PNT7_9FLAO|nr:hypothetical protein [Elizabethkingia argenteiflava]NAW50009.1 hypothetical protein [Elizabethkingia argenteiflava]